MFHLTPFHKQTTILYAGTRYSTAKHYTNSNQRRGLATLVKQLMRRVMPSRDWSSASIISCFGTAGYHSVILRTFHQSLLLL